MRIAPILIPMIKPVSVLMAGAGVIYAINQIEDPSLRLGIGGVSALVVGLGLGKLTNEMVREYREHYMPQRQERERQERR